MKEIINKKTFEIKKIWASGWIIFRDGKQISRYNSKEQATDALDYIRATQ